MRVPSKFATDLSIGTKNCVFDYTSRLPRWNFDRVELSHFLGRPITAGSLNYSRKLKKLLNLTKCIVHFLFKEKMPQELIDIMSPIEKKLMLLFIQKKKVFGHENAKLNQEFFESVRNREQCKRIEENLKFVFKKAANFMLKVFKDCLYPQVAEFLNPEIRSKSPVDRVEYAFYGFYFGHIAPKINQPIEKFFHPRSSEMERKRFGKVIPKTVSRLYINYLKMSPQYTYDMKKFLSECLVLEVRASIFNKVSRMCLNWQSYMDKHGEEKLLAMVTDNFKNNTKCKIAWSIQEVEGAVGQIIRLLDKI